MIHSHSKITGWSYCKTVHIRMGWRVGRIDIFAYVRVALWLKADSHVSNEGARQSRRPHLDKQGCVLFQEACQIYLQLLWIEALNNKHA